MTVQVATCHWKKRIDILVQRGEHGGRLVWLCGHCAVGIYEANFSSDLGQFDLEAESPSSGSSEECVYTHNVVFGVKTADPTAWECLSIWW